MNKLGISENRRYYKKDPNGNNKNEKKLSK